MLHRDIGNHMCHGPEYDRHMEEPDPTPQCQYCAAFNEIPGTAYGECDYFHDLALDNSEMTIRITARVHGGQSAAKCKGWDADFAEYDEDAA